MTVNRDKTMGIILIVIGLAIFLLNTKVLPNDVLLVLIGAAFLVGYYNKKVTGYLIAGLIFLALGIGSLVDKYVMTSLNLSGVMFMWSLGIAFLILFLVRKIKGFVYPGCILPAIGTFALLEQLYDKDITWVFFLLLALSFFVIYLFEKSITGHSWPLIPGVALMLISGLFFLTSEEIIKYDFWRILSYIWPVILIVIGIRIVYNNSKHK